jgi:cytochrome c-type biogenesis protein
VIDGSFALAFTAGMVATVNPCGFAMLPAYLSYFLGLGPPAGQTEQATAGLRRGLFVSAAVSAGFLAVFTVLGVLIRAGTDWVVDLAKYLSILIGLLLIVAGVAMVAGWRLPFTTPKLDKGGRDRTVGSMFVFGVSYAVASLGCTIGPFLAVVMGSFTRDSFVAGALSIAMYGLGMALVLTALTVTLALARGGLLRVLRTAMVYVDRFAGIFLILAGAYLVYYWVFNLTTDNGLSSDTGGGVAKVVERWSANAQTWIQDQGVWRLGLLLAGVVAAAVAAVVVSQRRRPSDRTAT